jgi:hypothetical protein
MRVARVAPTVGGVPNAMRTIAAPGLIMRLGLWSALALVLNLAWEIAHVSLYTIWLQADSLRIAQAVLHCSVGDALIALVTFALAGIVLWRTDWPASRPWTGGLIVVIGSVTFTGWSEWYNVYRGGTWGYTANMPMIFGIGLSPLLQWVIVPPVIVVAHKVLMREFRAAAEAAKPSRQDYDN